MLPITTPDAAGTDGSPARPAPSPDSAVTPPPPAAVTPAVTSAVPDDGAYAPFPCQVVASADLWFAERAADVERAKALCGPCPIRGACLAGAIGRGEPWGVWGGEVFVDGVVVASKRGRGRPRKNEFAAASTTAA